MLVMLMMLFLLIFLIVLVVILVIITLQQASALIEKTSIGRIILQRANTPFLAMYLATAGH